MPKATIYEYGQLVFWKNKVWLAKNPPPAPPASDPVELEELYQA